MSPRVTEQVLEDIRHRIDIVELIGGRVTLKRAGSSFKACCPFHREKTPSFHVSPARQSFHCFGCQAHGDVFGFLMRMDGLSFPDAIRTLAQRAGVELDERTDYGAAERQALYAIHSELAAFYQRCLHQTSEAQAARDYLKSRKLDDEVVERFGIGYAPRAPRDALQRWAAKHAFPIERLVEAGLLSPPNDPERPDEHYDRFRGRLMFPIRDTMGRVVAFSGRILDPKAHPAKYVNSPETRIFTKGRVLFALDRARTVIVRGARREAIVCEGQIDVIRCHAAGFETAVASQGTAFTPEHAALLKRYADCVLLVFDGDAAGRKAAVRTGALCLAADLPSRVAALPPGEDPDSFLRDRGADAFRAVLDAAVSLTAFQVDTLRAEEADAASVDAVRRVTRAVIETLAPCPSPVLRSHLLQEAAAKLHLPVDALTEELDACRAERERRAGRAAAANEGGEPMPEDVLPEEPTPEDIPAQPAAGAKDAPAAGRGPAARLGAARAARGLCELLLHHEDDAHIPDLLAKLLPPALVPDPRARCVVEAALAARRAGGAGLGTLGERPDPEMRAFLAGIAGGESRVRHSRDMTPLQEAQDHVVELWRHHLRAEREALAPSAGPAETARRQELTLCLKRLNDPRSAWSAREAVLRAERARLDAAPALAPTPSPGPAPEGAEAAAPAVRAADDAAATAAPASPPSSTGLPAGTAG